VRLAHCLGKYLFAIVIGCMPCAHVFAQAGPPLVTDDPGTPGDGHWEINLGNIATQTAQNWSINVLDADINYGWGDRIQLKIDAPWTYARESGGDWQSGLGSVIVGVKWRFLGEADQGFSLSTYPQYTSAWSAYSKHHGVADIDSQFYLPVEWATKVGEWEFAGEFGRNFVQHSSSQWEAGIVAAHGCVTERLECLLEVHETAAPHDAQTLLNVGMRWKFTDSLFLLAAVGREAGPPTDDRQQFLSYIGFQILR
jgi:hypothetical protein